MKTTALILFPFGLVAIAYAVTAAERARPAPAFTTPDFTTDRYGREHPTGFKNTLPANYNPPAEND